MNSRQKGAAGEREWSKFLTQLGFPARRGQQFSGSKDSPDVVGGLPGTHCEVKRVQALNIHDAMDQAVRDSGGRNIPYVAHRKNNKPWLVTVRAEDMIQFGEAVYAALQRSKT